MHKRTLMLQGAFQGGKIKIKIKGGVVPDVTTEGPCVLDALEQASCLLGRRAMEVRKTLCFPELKNSGITSRLDSWARKGMIFFVWRSQSKHLLAFLMPLTSTDFEVDEVLEELLDLTTCVPDLGNCTGRKEGLVSYDITRVTKDALEVIVMYDNPSVPHIGYAGSGTSLSEAIRGVSKIMNC